jgi:hypothetical protein
LPGNRRAEQDAFLPAAARAIGMGNPVDEGPSCLWRGVRPGRAEGVRWSPGKGGSARWRPQGFSCCGQVGLHTYENCFFIDSPLGAQWSSEISPTRGDAGSALGGMPKFPSNVNIYLMKFMSDDGGLPILFYLGES